MLLGGGTSFAVPVVPIPTSEQSTNPRCWMFGVGWFRDQSWSRSMVNFWGVPSDSTLQGTITFHFPEEKGKNHRLRSAFLRGRILSLVSWRVVHCFGLVISWPPVICIYLSPFESLRCQGLSRGGTCTCGLRKGLVSGCRLWGGQCGCELRGDPKALVPGAVFVLYWKGCVRECPFCPRGYGIDEVQLFVLFGSFVVV